MNEQFDFEAEFSLLDIGATSSLLRTGTVRPTILAFTDGGGVEAVSLTWEEESEVARAFEEARRYVRDLNPTAYAVIAHVQRNGASIRYLRPDGRAGAGPEEHLALGLFGRSGYSRIVSYPIRRAQGCASLGIPSVADAESSRWKPLGDLWSNPFCEGDRVRFRPPDRAVDPSSSLWQAIVELTRMRIHEDQANADEYMSFLDDLRNGLFVVHARSERDDGVVLLRPGTTFNPIGTLAADASRLRLEESLPADVEKVAAQ